VHPAARVENTLELTAAPDAPVRGQGVRGH
jgi:hypothetical protein